MEINTARLRSMKIVTKSDGRYLRIGYVADEAPRGKNRKSGKSSVLMNAPPSRKPHASALAAGKALGNNITRRVQRAGGAMGKNLGAAVTATLRGAWKNRASRNIMLWSAAAIVVTLIARAIH